MVDYKGMHLNKEMVSIVSKIFNKKPERDWIFLTDIFRYKPLFAKDLTSLKQAIRLANLFGNGKELAEKAAQASTVTPHVIIMNHLIIFREKWEENFGTGKRH
ncbi:MAG: hypothetical protein LBE38_04350 [Deltaproteobacteria bacterium]|jgi:hypothetical protein|nr:hypothetical protein [Deltaproteobacteria bacterium]